MTSGRSPQIVLAFDFGTRRIGVASGDTLTRTARPLRTIERKQQIPWTLFDALLREYLPSRLIVGIPYNVDGTDTLLTAACVAFARELESRSQLPVELVDERYSSKEAERELQLARQSGLKSRRVTHADVDMVAAKLILERWFAGLPA